MWVKTEDEDDWVMAADLQPVVDKACGGVRIVRLHAPLLHNLREVVKETRFKTMEVWEDHMPANAATAARRRE